MSFLKKTYIMYLVASMIIVLVLIVFLKYKKDTNERPSRFDLCQIENQPVSYMGQKRFILSIKKDTNSNVIVILDNGEKVDAFNKDLYICDRYKQNN